ncbi:hypothetical protein KKH15_00885 [Patescibacteria group bacterium]|nr:hypothetical protein [Patescibacteria group bacterium]MBU1754816.1 hypothetical protein [Patescibacteria group bacterium]
MELSYTPIFEIDQELALPKRDFSRDGWEGTKVVRVDGDSLQLSKVVGVRFSDISGLTRNNFFSLLYTCPENGTVFTLLGLASYQALGEWGDLRRQCTIAEKEWCFLFAGHAIKTSGTERQLGILAAQYEYGKDRLNWRPKLAFSPLRRSDYFLVQLLK